MKNIVIFGGPGSGKGTQSELIMKKYGLGHISTGDVLRQEIKQQTELGKTAAAYIDKGQLIAEGSVDELKSMIKKSEMIKIEAKGISDDDLDRLRRLDNIFSVDYDGKHLKIEAGKGNNVVGVIKLLEEKGYRMKNVYSEQPTLNDVFLELTGKELRDD